MPNKIHRRSFSLALAACVISLSACHGQGTYHEESARLGKLLHWQPGSVVAEIGAGEGIMTLDAAEAVGATGQVYTTEIDPKKLEHLQELASQSKLHNLTALKAAEDGTNLPPECCNSIFMRRVYHHFTEPAKMDASLFASLKPGGMLAVIDFPPRAGLPKVEGVPANRGGHGVPKEIVMEELTAAGFHLESTIPGWPEDDYCLIFRKPEAEKSN
jgi:predicted methyltransferase